MKIVIFAFLILILNVVNAANIISENLTITGVSYKNTYCFIGTSDAITSKCLDLAICKFANKLISKPIMVTIEKYQPSDLYVNEEIVSMKLANKQTKYYNGKPNARQSFLLNGLIDDIKLYNNNRCYLSIADKSDEQNSYKFQKVRDNEMCEYAQDLFLKNAHVTATIHYDPVFNYANDLVSIMSINDKIKEIFRDDGLRYCKKPGGGAVEMTENWKRFPDELRRRRFVDGWRGSSMHLRKFKRELERDAVDMSILLALYFALPSVQRSFSTPNRNQPISELGTVSVMTNNQNVNVPLYLRATISSNRVVHNRRPWTPEVESQMENMGMLLDDERGHLLAQSLGGSQLPSNIVPMAKNVNRHMSIGDGSLIQSNTDVNPNNLPFKQNLGEMSYPLSIWRSNEAYIEKFLRDNPGGRVEYTVVVQYEDLISRIEGGERIEPQNLRPTHFMQYIVMYDAGGNLVDNVGPITLINDIDFQCTNVEPK